ncbi:putative GTP-binding protein 6 isoform X2 [Sitophilus oryzae]|nr:putative GTP-binding protein 6 isoform X2 [Sitophilus oryzae]
MILGYCRILRKSSNRLRRIYISACLRYSSSNNFEELSDSEYNKLTDSYFHIKEAHRCLIIQPYVKWGPKKLNITPEEQLSEAIALIQTLPSWTVEDTLTVPLDTLDRKALFKSGSMERIKQVVIQRPEISAIFINSSSLKKATTVILQENFKRAIMDRYKIVMKILKTHAISKHAKLQVSLAELAYLKKKSEQDLIFKTYSSEALKLMFQNREQKIKSEIENLRSHRNLLRNKRKKIDYPVVAVVGYTNAGKTSLIKALTNEASLQPKDQLFATLDVTVHKGILPSGLDVLYIDTVGFISDIPTNLIECFVATLEDALLADVILHVEDLSSISFDYKRQHVLNVLKSLGKDENSDDLSSKIFAVGNKCDLLKLDTEKRETDVNVSAQKGIG